MAFVPQSLIKQLSSNRYVRGYKAKLTPRVIEVLQDIAEQEQFLGETEFNFEKAAQRLLKRRFKGQIDTDAARALLSAFGEGVEVFVGMDDLDSYDRTEGSRSSWINQAM